MGKVAHAEVARRGLLGNDIVLGNALVDMYAKCGAFYEAKELLYVLPVQNVVSWTALISGYAKHGQGRQALDCFTEMQHNGLSPNPITFPCILKACGSTKEIVKGEVVHAKILELGLLRDAAIGNALVDMYAKFGQLLNAQQVFDILPNQNLVSWNTLLAGYSLHGHGERVLTLYQKMRLKGIFGDDASFSCVLSACGSARNLGMGREIHDELVKRGLLKRSCILGNALLDMYAKCGALTEAQVIFDELVVQDVISWTALIVGYYQHGLGVAALHCFDQMKHEGFTPDAVTFTCILKACGSVGALEKGKEIHSEVISGGCLEETAVIGNGLVEMYTRCGALQKAQKVFDELPVHDVNTWNALMAGYAQVGMHEIVFDYFNKLLEDGIRPNFETFFILLSVCSGSGLVDEGQMYYNAMGSNFNISPTLEHCNCMVYLLGLSGQFNEAVQMIKKLPASCDSSLWYGLLSACQPWGYEKFAGFAFDNAIMVNRKDLTMVH
ncbi:hypothetical protein KP509_29G053300 [Ceratopteris richardii]|nr:hypothetical protein KP509_29G053300 [Ceratopteris richardii]